MSKLTRKGQAALEFLTTYGWAFMVILVMIGALAYFGVLDPTGLIPDSCSVTSGYSCGDYLIEMKGAGNEALNFTLLNNMNSQITVRNFNVTRAGVVACTGNPTYKTTAIADGEKFQINCSTTTAMIGKSAGKAKLKFTFEYKTSDGDYWHSASGTITSTIVK